MEKSAEYQHLALRLMARHAANPHPICYAVWYEYASGNNLALNAAIDSIVAQGEVLDDSAISALYHEHIAGSSALPDGLSESHREIEKLQAEILRAREDALTDGLTGLLNRRGFELKFQDGLIAHSHNTGPAPSLLIADVDYFKKINDSYGHAFGDRVICAVAKILRDNVKGRDIAARYGGEEFIVLLPDTPLQGAHFLAEKIRTTVATSRFLRMDDTETDASVTISIGVARHRCGESPISFLERADVALYASKANGRNRVTVAETMASD
jgi:diguanylate cyclase